MAEETVTAVEPSIPSNPNQEKDKRERSQIVFPYSDMKEGIAVAQAIWNNVATAPCELAQLAAWLDHDSVTSGSFRGKVNAARIFGLVETGPNSVKLTALGRRIVDPQKGPAAKVDAFLTVPLYQAIYERYAGSLLPNNVGLEKEMTELGVAAKQADKARQAFQRSAQEAGFFRQGSNKLVKPAFAVPEQELGQRHEPQGTGPGGGGERPPMHPFVEGLVKTLPDAGTVWPDAGQQQWLDAAKAIFKLIYLPPEDSKTPPPTEPRDAADPN
jgi:hypothetical protein